MQSVLVGKSSPSAENERRKRRAQLATSNEPEYFVVEHVGSSGGVDSVGAIHASGQVENEDDGVTVDSVFEEPREDSGRDVG